MSASEDIIRHIIKDIIQTSTDILKGRKLQSQSDLEHEEAWADSLAVQPTPPSIPLPDLQHLFASGIRSHIQQYQISDTLAAFIVRAVVLDPRNDFRIERELSKDEVSRLITVLNLCTDKIVSSNNPIMETVKMQVYFDTLFPSQADYLHVEKMTRISDCVQVLREITELKTKNISVYEGLYRKIVTFVLLRSHVGSATDFRVIREATAALESVFPQSELSAFLSLSRNEKEAQLNGLTQLVTGIRLFNKNLGKVVSLCANELSSLTDDLNIQTNQTETRLQTFAAVIDYSEKVVDTEINVGTISRIKSSIVFNRQYLMYLDALHDQLLRTRETLEQIGTRFDETIHDLKETCKSKTAVPVDQVYPQFISLANLWSLWMDELFLIAFRRGILDNIQFHLNSFELQLDPELVKHCEEYKKDIEPDVLPESQIVFRAGDMMVAISIINKAIEVVHPGNSTQYFKLPVEYGGYCPYVLIKRDGLVVPGDKNLGLLRYRDKLFSFETEEGAREFAKFPDRYMEGVLEMAKRSPDLVQLLHLYNYFPTVDALENAKSFTRQRLMGQMPLVSEAGCQVDTHIIDTKIDPKYQWNEWELRRQALMLVNLKNKLTHSSQTEISHYRRESETQHYAPKAQTTQTRSDSSTNVPRKVNYMAGLRNDGKGAQKFRLLDLTIKD